MGRAGKEGLLPFYSRQILLDIGFADTRLSRFRQLNLIYRSSINEAILTEAPRRKRTATFVINESIKVEFSLSLSHRILFSQDV